MSLVAAGALPARAEYPDRLVRVLVPIPPGGAPDLVARLVAQSMSETFGQPVVVENRPGANGNLAADAVAKAPPDGYTLLSGADSGIVINPHVYAKLGFDPLKDLMPVASVATNQFILAVNPKVPVHSLTEFVDYARKANPPLAYASGGVGSQQHFAMEALKRLAGINLLHVPYRGGTPSATATIGGETQVLFAGASSAGQFEAGNLRPLAASGKARSKRFPESPDHRRVLSRLRGRHLARPVRAGRHAGAGHSQNPRGGARRTAPPRHRREAQRLRQPRAADPRPARVRGVDPPRLRAVRRAGEAVRHQARLSVRSRLRQASRQRSWPGLSRPPRSCGTAVPYLSGSPGQAR